LPVPEGNWDSPTPTTAATPEEVDVVTALHLLVSHVPRFVTRVITGEVRPGEWLEIATLLVDAATVCRTRAIVDAPVGAPAGGGDIRCGKR